LGNKYWIHTCKYVCTYMKISSGEICGNLVLMLTYVSPEFHPKSFLWHHRTSTYTHFMYIHTYVQNVKSFLNNNTNILKIFECLLQEYIIQWPVSLSNNMLYDTYSIGFLSAVLIFPLDFYPTSQYHSRVLHAGSWNCLGSGSWLGQT